MGRQRAAPKQQPPAGTPTGTPRAYSRVNTAVELGPDAFEGVQKTGNAYSARLRHPVLVQTPAVVLLSSLDDADVGHAHLKVSSSPRFVQFVERVEEALLATSLQSKDAWFRHEVHDDVLRASFRSFYKAGALRVRVPQDALVFDEEGRVAGRDAVLTGSTLRCLLELSKVTFGRTEYGAMWSLVQAQVVPPPPPPPPPAAPKCLIDPDLERDDEEDEMPELESLHSGTSVSDPGSQPDPEQKPGLESEPGFDELSDAVVVA